MTELLILKNVVVTDADETPLTVLRPGEVVQATAERVPGCPESWIVVEPARLRGLSLDPMDAEQVLTLAGAARWLTARGFPRTAAAVRALLKRFRFPGALKVRGLGPGGGGQWRVPVGDLEAWIATKEKRI